jgi:hypothetical protein
MVLQRLLPQPFGENMLALKTALPRLSLIGVFISAVSITAPASETISTQADQTAIAVTIYNDNLALVRDARRVTLARGVNQLAWRDVSAQIQPETTQMRNLDKDNTRGFHLLEQNFDFDLLTPAKLLEKYLGQEVTVIRTNPATGTDSRETATVLATNGGVVLKYADRIETGVPGRLAFAGVPDTLRDRPTLGMSLLNPAAGEQHLELTYLTSGLSWHADYVAELSAHDDALSLNGWVTLTNQSGTAYPDASLQLVAGDINRVREQMDMQRGVVAMTTKVAAAPMHEEALFEYHLYTLPHSTTLADNQTKQVALMSASDVPVSKQFLLAGANYYYSGQYADLGQKLKVGVYVEFRNAGNGLGIPLPKGILRVYKKDTLGNVQFVGEDRIDHTPKNETVRLKLGDAFDLTADKRQTDFQKQASSTRVTSVFESAYQIEIRNAKTEAVTVTVREPMPGDWTMLNESQPHTKPASGVAEWAVKVPAEGKAMLTYRVRVKY